MAIKELYQIKSLGGTDFQDAVLHTKTSPVLSINEEIEQIIQDLKDTLWAYPFCVGLSAPQIGYSYAISVLNIDHSSFDDTLVLINPEIIEASGKKDKKRESCMSVWGKFGEVERRDKILLKYQNENFETMHQQFEGFMSRAIQHEVDHLNGIIYVDKLVSGKQLGEAEFFKDYCIIKSS